MLEVREDTLLNSSKRVVRKLLLTRVARAVAREQLTYLSVEKLFRLEKAARATGNLSGDVLEFGVALGGSGIILAHHADPRRKFIGFDVFGMIPPPTSTKDDVESKRRYETIAAGKSVGLGGNDYYGYKKDLMAEVKSCFARYGYPVDGSKVTLIKGLFEDTWPSAGVTSVSLAHIDCDWYDPVSYCLSSIADILEDGGIIVIDDYHDYGGCKTAVDEFVAARADFQLNLGANPFLIKHSAP